MKPRMTTLKTLVLGTIKATDFLFFKGEPVRRDYLGLDHMFHNIETNASRLVLWSGVSLLKSRSGLTSRVYNGVEAIIVPLDLSEAPAEIRKSYSHIIDSLAESRRSGMEKPVLIMLLASGPINHESQVEWEKLKPGFEKESSFLASASILTKAEQIEDVLSEIGSKLLAGPVVSEVETSSVAAAGAETAPESASVLGQFWSRLWGASSDKEHSGAEVSAGASVVPVAPLSVEPVRVPANPLEAARIASVLASESKERRILMSEVNKLINPSLFN